MSEPGKNRFTVASSNQMLRDIHKSLRHLHVRESLANHQQCQPDISGNETCQQGQSSFEQQLALGSNINALTQSAAGERRSYPRATKQFTLEEIRQDLKPWRNGTHLSSGGYIHGDGYYTKVDGNHQNFKSSSFSDLSRGEKGISSTGNSCSVDQQRLSILLSCGFDENIAVETLRNNSGVSMDTIIEILNSVSVAHKKLPNNTGGRVPQSQRLFGGAPHTTPRSSANVFNPQSNTRPSNNIGSNRYNGTPIYYVKRGSLDPSHRTPYQSNHAIYDPSTVRHYSGADRSNVLNSESHFTQISQPNNFSDGRPSGMYSNPGDLHSMDTNQRKLSNDSHGWKVQKQVDPPPVKRSSLYEDVTLRQKSSDRITPIQNRWSAEVYAVPYDYSDKRSSLELFPQKPPPPYPGYINKSSHRHPNNQDADIVQACTNTPITVIFDEKNDRVNVVGGIPEAYEKVMPSPSSSGPSSPHQSQSHKDPPPYIYTSSSPQIHKIQPQYIQSPSASQVNLPHPSQTQQTPPHVYIGSIHAPHSQSVDINFVPIKEPVHRDRGSPPPYTYRCNQKGSNRSSINLDELEISSVREYQGGHYHSSDSGCSSKRTSTATEPGSFNQSDSSASASPTPDGVERSYSPLPTCTTTQCETMIIHEKVEEKVEDKNEKEGERFSTRLKNYTPQAYKFFMEQHVENLIKLQEQRKHRRTQLEAEMARVGLAGQAQEEMRKLLNKKESNYIRLRRAKMDISMFTKIVTVGVGAFGEVNLVRKNETNAYYAMKILQKSEVLRRNQVAHVKAERDILAEADNEWVVKLYYSFQNEQNLYFVMDYIPGGDLMALLIKFGIFEQALAKFYISELTLAIESVHKLGFIHRDIKPDNVLIDRNGHIKLTDFGLCTGFHWTHDSKYYQPQTEGGHSRQFSMEPEGGWESLLNDVNCDCKKLKLQDDLCKPLKRRKLRRHMRCQAHSLVGTPNYIAPEVLMRVPYSQQCDWWSVGVILYEMLIGQPPFLAPSPAETQIKVINWQHTLSIPKNSLHKHSKDLIRKLCTSPEERLGKEGADEIKQHPYFRDINFHTIHQESAPYIPTIKHPTDTSNFDPVPEHLLSNDNALQTEKVHNNKNGPDYAFYEFTFRHFFDDGGMANPNFELQDQEKPKSLSHAKRPNTTSNKSMTIPTKVPAPSSSGSEEKAPIYV